jgi:hypothetical protein
VILIVVNMSESSLSLPPLDEYENDSQEVLPTPIPPTPIPIRSSDLLLPDSESILFTKGLYSRTILDSTFSKILFKCMQPFCTYAPSQPTKTQTTSNLWKHIKTQHPLVHTKYGKKQLSSTDSRPSSPATFFQPRKAHTHALNTSKYRELLLSFIVSNNLPLRISDSPSFRQLVSHLSPTTLTIGRMTIARDLQRIFCIHKAKLELELQQQIKEGG